MILRYSISSPQLVLAFWYADSRHIKSEKKHWGEDRQVFKELMKNKNREESFVKENFGSWRISFIYRGVVTGGRGAGGPWPPHFSFWTKQGPIFSVSVTGSQKLYGPEISQFLPCILQVLDNLRQLFIFSNCIGEMEHFTLDLLKRFGT